LTSDRLKLVFINFLRFLFDAAGPDRIVSKTRLSEIFAGESGFCFQPPPRKTFPAGKIFTVALTKFLVISASDVPVFDVTFIQGSDEFLLAVNFELMVLLLKSADIVKSEFHVIVKLNLCRSIHCLPLCTFLSPTLHATTVGNPVH
jgi:hypothetical protein